MTSLPLIALSERPAIVGDGCCQKLARFFVQHEGQWIDGRTLATVAGAYGWRTRASELRHGPYFMAIENRQRREVDPRGKKFTISEYRYVENG